MTCCVAGELTAQHAHDVGVDEPATYRAFMVGERAAGYGRPHCLVGGPGVGRVVVVLVVYAELMDQRLNRTRRWSRVSPRN